MAQLELTYFDDNKGRNELSRLICAVGGIPYRDEAINMMEYRSRRDAGLLPYGQLPTLKVDGEAFGQSCAMARYLARRAGLYPTDELEQLRSDGVVDSWRDLLDLFYETVFGRHIINGKLSMFPHPQEVRHVKLANFVGTTLVEHFGLYEGMLHSRGGFCRSAPFPSWADLALYDLVKTMHGVLEPEVFDTLMSPLPNVGYLVARVDALEPVQQHIERHPYRNISHMFHAVPRWRASIEAVLFPVMRMVMAVVFGLRRFWNGMMGGKVPLRRSRDE